MKENIKNIGVTILGLVFLFFVIALPYLLKQIAPFLFAHSEQISDRACFDFVGIGCTIFAMLLIILIDLVSEKWRRTK